MSSFLNRYKDAVDSTGLIRTPRNFRELCEREKGVARKVFKNTLPYSRIVITDGLGYDDRPFTVPVVGTSSRTYMLHVGSRFQGMTRRDRDQELLIHELTHVWQGEHSIWVWSYVFRSAWHQWRSNDAYAYDSNHWKEWRDYNPEQQAQIVEEWFQGGMKGDADSNEPVAQRPYRYIVENIRGELWTPRVRPLAEGKLNVAMAYPPLDGQLLPLLEKRFNLSDESGWRQRARDVEDVLNGADSRQAQTLLIRFRQPKPDDPLASSFHRNLAGPTRTRLMAVLQTRAASPA